jgi:hypothetical protein
MLFFVIETFDACSSACASALTWHSDTNLSGRSLTVVGVVKKGYVWVNPNYPGWWTHYIDATSIYQD